MTVTSYGCISSSRTTFKLVLDKWHVISGIRLCWIVWNSDTWICDIETDVKVKSSMNSTWNLVPCLMKYNTGIQAFNANSCYHQTTAHGLDLQPSIRRKLGTKILYCYICIHICLSIDRQTDRQIGRQTCRQTDRQTDRHADRDRDRGRHRYRYIFYIWHLNC